MDHYWNLMDAERICFLYCMLGLEGHHCGIGMTSLPAMKSMTSLASQTLLLMSRQRRRPAKKQLRDITIFTINSHKERIRTTHHNGHDYDDENHALIRQRSHSGAQSLPGHETLVVHSHPCITNIVHDAPR